MRCCDEQLSAGKNQHNLDPCHLCEVHAQRLSKDGACFCSLLCWPVHQAKLWLSLHNEHALVPDDGYRSHNQSGSGNALGYPTGLYSHREMACFPVSALILLAAPPPPYACKQRAIYLANLAACDIARGDNAEALRACSAAIEEDPTYIKVGVQGRHAGSFRANHRVVNASINLSALKEKVSDEGPQ
eukprot:818881-Pelagomonas_calceolata.AAC.3